MNCKQVIIHWNSQSLLPKLEFVKDLLKRDSPIAVTINDHRTTTDLSITGYRCIRYHNIMTLIKNGIPLNNNKSSSYHSENKITIQTTSISISNISISLMNVYRMPGKSDDNIWEKLEDMIFKMKQNSSYLIINGDFNCPAGSESRSKLKMIMQSQSLHLLNKQNVSTHNRGNELDLALVTNTRLVQAFEVDSDNRLLLFSDHRPLTITLKLQIENVDNHVSFRENLTEQESKNYKTTLDQQLNEHLHGVDDIYSNIHESMIYSALLNLRLKTKTAVKTTIKSKAFLNKVKQIHNAWNRIRRGHSYEWVQYNHLRSELKKIVIEEKQKVFKEMIADIETNTWTNATKMIITKSTKAVKGVPDSVVNQNNEAPISFQASLNNLCRHFSNTNTENKHHSFQNFENSNIDQIKFLKQRNNNFISIRSGPFDNEITYEETEQVYKQTRKTAKGPDGLDWFLFNHMTHKLLRCLHHLYQKMWNESKIPKLLKQARVVAIYKKGEREIASNYRPISITSIIIRKMEKIVKNRLNSKDSSLHQFQAGFRPNRSTSDHLLKLNEIINEAKQKQINIPIIFLDIKSAFDRIPIHMILNALINKGLTGKFLAFVENFLTNRTIFVEHDNRKSQTLVTTAGIPQGSVIAPIIFNYFIDGLCEIISNKSDGAFFADDILIIPRMNNDTNIMIRELQETLNDVTEWSLINKVQFSQEKSQYILFNGQTCNRQYKLRLNDFLLKRAKIYKYLGILFHETFSFNKHFNAIKKKLTWMNYTISRLTQPLSNQIVSLPTLRTIISATIKAILGYGLCFLQYNEEQMILMDNQIAKSFRRVLNLQQSTGTKSLLVESQILPVKQFQQQLTFNLAKSINSNKEVNPNAYKILQNAIGKSQQAQSHFVKNLKQVEKDYSIHHQNEKSNIKPKLFNTAYQHWINTYGNTRECQRLGLRKIKKDWKLSEHYKHDQPLLASIRTKWRFDRANLNGNWLHRQIHKHDEHCYLCYSESFQPKIETREHALLECKFFDYYRLDMYNQIRKYEPTITINLDLLMGNYQHANEQTTKKILQITGSFIQQIERLKKST